MDQQQSPLMRLMQTDGFKPFSGSDAIRVYGKARERLNMDKVEEDDLLKAVSSLGVLLETEIALLYALQDKLCTNCGVCCTENRSMRLTKIELKQVAEKQNISYKKLKKQIHARPNNNGTFTISRKPCAFYKDGCTIYNYRPSICRSYPASKVLKALGGKGKYPRECPISDDLLVELAIKRALEEKMHRENPELMQELVEKKQRDLQRLKGLTQSQRLAYLAKRYQRNLKQEE